MRYAISLALFCACLSGQPDGSRPTRDLAVTRSVDGGAVTVHLRNDYSSPATAWVLRCETPQGGSRYHWTDQDLSFETKPLDPGKEIEFKIPPPRPSPMMQRPADTVECEDFHLAAAIFADGTVSGELSWINAIAADRRQAYQDIAKASDIINTAISNGADTAAVIKQLGDWQKSERPGGMPARPSATHGPVSGWSSRGTAPPSFRPFGGPVAGAALWLIDTQKKTLPEALTALAAWRGRLAKLAPVAETGEPSTPRSRMLASGLFTPQSEPELVGKPAPGFTLKDVDDHEFTLGNLRGKPVLLDFWATWCEPCRAEMPHIKSLYDQFKNSGLEVVCVDTNEPSEKPRKYFEDQKYSFVNLVGQGSDVPQKYGAGPIPRVVLIDKDGVVRYVHGGWGTNMDLTPEVKKLVAPEAR